MLQQSMIAIGSDESLTLLACASSRTVAMNVLGTVPMSFLLYILLCAENSLYSESAISQAGKR